MATHGANDAQRLGERRASTMLNDCTTLPARPFDLQLGLTQAMRRTGLLTTFLLGEEIPKTALCLAKAGLSEHH